MALLELLISCLPSIGCLAELLQKLHNRMKLFKADRVVFFKTIVRGISSSIWCLARIALMLKASAA